MSFNGKNPIFTTPDGERAIVTTFLDVPDRHVERCTETGRRGKPCKNGFSFLICLMISEHL